MSIDKELKIAVVDDMEADCVQIVDMTKEILCNAGIPIVYPAMLTESPFLTISAAVSNITYRSDNNTTKFRPELSGTLATCNP